MNACRNINAKNFMCALCIPRLRQDKCALQILNKDANRYGNTYTKNASRNMNAKLCMCAGHRYIEAN